MSGFPPLVISSADLLRSGVTLDPRALHDRAAQMWRDVDMATIGTGKKSVLLPPEHALWTLRQYAGFRPRFAGERLGWKLSALTAFGPRLASVKIVGANAANRLLGYPRSFSTILLLDAPTMRPVCLLEGTDVSAARTATYATLVGEAILFGRSSAKVFLFGGGPIARRICLALDALFGARVERLWIKTRSLETAEAFVRSLAPVSCTITAVADTENLAEADLVITASNAKTPVFDPSAIAETATVLHLAGDETPFAFIARALHNRSVYCDDIAMVSARNSQSLALHFSRQGSTLEAEAMALGVRQLPAYLARQPADPGPTHITCVGVPSLDLYVAEHIYHAYLAANPDLLVDPVSREAGP